MRKREIQTEGKAHELQETKIEKIPWIQRVRRESEEKEKKERRRRARERDEWASDSEREIEIV